MSSTSDVCYPRVMYVIYEWCMLSTSDVCYHDWCSGLFICIISMENAL